jgi:hypothetical protein
MPRVERHQSNLSHRAAALLSGEERTADGDGGEQSRESGSHRSNYSSPVRDSEATEIAETLTNGETEKTESKRRRTSWLLTLRGRDAGRRPAHG